MSSTRTLLAPLEAEVETVMDGKRWYSFETEEGKKTFPSVTTILSETKNDEGLKRWRRRVGEKEAERIRSEAAERGSAFHSWVESYLKDETPPSTATQAMWRDWYVLQSAAPLLLEGPLFSDIGYAGTTDLIAETSKGVCVFDWKTASKIPQKEAYIYDYKLQVSSYALAFEERYGIKVDRCCLVFVVEGEEEPYCVDVNPELYMLSFRDRLFSYYWE